MYLFLLNLFFLTNIVMNILSELGELSGIIWTL